MYVILTSIRQYFFRKIPYFKEKYGFRDRFLYSNTMYTALEDTTEKVAGLPFRELLRRYFFQPLNMSNSGVINDFNNWEDKVTQAFVEVDDGRSVPMIRQTQRCVLWPYEIPILIINH